MIPSPLCFISHDLTWQHPHTFASTRGEVALHHCPKCTASLLPTCIPEYIPWWLRLQRICLLCRRPRFNLSIGTIPRRREWQSTPVFWPGESHGQRSLVGYGPWESQNVRHTELLTLSSISTFLVSRLLVAQVGVTIRWVVTL